MENDKIEIIGTGVLKHYKKGVLYGISKSRLRTIPKDSYILAQTGGIVETPPFVAEIATPRVPKNLGKADEAKVD